MKVAVVGSGVSGLTTARALAVAGLEVVLFERKVGIGGQALTINVDGVSLDVGFLVFNHHWQRILSEDICDMSTRSTYVFLAEQTSPNMLEYFDEAGVEMGTSELSLAVSLAKGRGFEWSSACLGGLFAQRTNLLNPYFWNMVYEMAKFAENVLKYLKMVEGDDTSLGIKATLAEFLQSHGYSKKFRDSYLMPVCESIWSCSPATVLCLNAVSVLTFFRDHQLLQPLGCSRWLTVKGNSEAYINKMGEELKTAGAEIRTGTEVTDIKRMEDGTLQLECEGGVFEKFDKCIVATSASNALKILGQSATQTEKLVLGGIQYTHSEVYLHRDKAFMPLNTSAWSARNFVGDINGRVCVTYWLNLLQDLGDTGQPYLLTVNPANKPKHVEHLWRIQHPRESSNAPDRADIMDTIQGKLGVWYSGSCQGYGVHENGIETGVKVAKQVLNKNSQVIKPEKQRFLTWAEYGARQVTIATLKTFIRTGHLRILEASGEVVDFVGDENGCNLKCILRIENPAFYWKLATRADLGLADSYVDGDFSFVGDNKKNNLLNLFKLVIENRDESQHETQSNRFVPKKPFQQRLWSWKNPLLLMTTFLGLSVSYTRHIFRHNSLTNARQNISQHYDLSNEMFSLFLDETMSYSCAIFKGPNETLKDAQLQKVHVLIDKARVHSTHEVLEIGFGWGTLAIEVVRRTGCRYTGVTLSKEQLEYAQEYVKESGLQDQVTLLLCDYREITHSHKFDRIIACEMVEHIGHEYYMEFFNKCDDLLAKDGLVVLQTSSLPDMRYDDYRKSTDFIKEYIFPGCCIPCVSVLTAAMTAGSTLSVHHLEDIGPQYFKTLMSWRDNFVANYEKVRRLGFSEKFIRTWEYYFVYCAAGFQTCTLGVLQMVLSRPGNMAALGDPYT